MAVEDLILAAKVHRAELDAQTGGASHPHDLILHVHGIPFAVGDLVRDSVTGQMVEVVHGGTENVNQ